MANFGQTFEFGEFGIFFKYFPTLLKVSSTTTQLDVCVGHRGRNIIVSAHVSGNYVQLKKEKVALLLHYGGNTRRIYILPSLQRIPPLRLLAKWNVIGFYEGLNMA